MIDSSVHALHHCKLNFSLTCKEFITK